MANVTSETHAFPRGEAMNFASALAAMKQNGNAINQESDKGYLTEGFSGHLHYNYYSPVSQPKGVILALHGAGNNSAFYYDLSQQAIEKGYAVYAFDFPGHGLSHTKDNYDIFNIADEMGTAFLQIRAENDQKELPLFGMGSSFGGHILMLTADKINYTAIALNDVGPRIENDKHARAIKFFRNQKTYGNLDLTMDYCGFVYGRYGLLNTKGTQEFLKNSINYDEQKDAYRLNLDPRFSNIYLNIAHHPGIADDSFYDEDLKQTIYSMNLTDYYQKMKMPKMIIRGEKSGLLTEKHIEKMLEETKDSITHIIRVEDVAHPVGLSDISLNEKILTFFEAHRLN